MLYRGLERGQTLVDRQQLDNRGPGINQVLKRIADLVKRGQNLLQDAKSNSASGNGRY